MNNKGFAITTILYGLLIMFLLLITSLVSMLSVYKDRLSILIDSENGARDIINETKPLPIAYAIYNSMDNSLTFSKTTEKIYSDNSGKYYTYVYNGFEKNEEVLWSEVANKIKKVVFEDEITPNSTKGWFKGLVNCSELYLEKLNVSNVTDMSDMFNGAGSNVTSFQIYGLENWDVSKVINMSKMFWETGKSSATFELDLSGWNISNVNNCTDFISSAENEKIKLPEFTNCSIE